VLFRQELPGLLVLGEWLLVELLLQARGTQVLQVLQALASRLRLVPRNFRALAEPVLLARE
jgi:hypothetical protein